MTGNNMYIHWPKTDLPDGFEDAASYLRHLVEEGARKRYGCIDTRISERMKEELNCLKGYEPYFLVLYDIVEYYKGKKIFVTACHDSVACSIVNYCLGITMVDPLKWALPFGQFFLETEMDFPHVELMVDEEGNCAETALSYLERKYGYGCVTNVYDRYEDSTTYYGSSTRIPSVDSYTIFFFDKPFEEAVGAIPVRGSFCYSEEDIPKYSKEILDELGYMHVVIHPIYVSSDLLSEIERETGINYLMEDIPLDDMETYDNLAEGEAPEGSFDRDWMYFCSEVRPQCEIGFWDLCNVLSLGYHSSFELYIKRKKNVDENKDDSPVSQILENTLGMVLYQEQIIEILQRFTGMDYREAEKTRRDLRSYDDKKIDSCAETIMKGCLKNGLTQKEAFHILNLILTNVHATSNFSHIIYHALNTYREAWLRVHFPEQYQKLKEKNEDDDLF